jgi:alanine-glyoxylate transaminase/serine-glyoxylate transaminase/serine-pyruvate transaminase
MDEWGVDVALTGSQKALSLPTGMGIVCASPKALEASKTAKSFRVFFDWKDYLKFYNLGTFWPYTPSIQLLYGLRAALDLLFAEGLENVFERHARLGKATRLLPFLLCFPFNYFRKLSQSLNCLTDAQFMTP